MPSLKVAIFGATGESGTSIVNGLLESSISFEIIALTRPASLRKPKTLALQYRGVTVTPYDVTTPVEQQAEALRDVDVVIAAVGFEALRDQIPLATAAKAAGVKRFVPSFFATVAPPKDVIDMREMKEDVLSHIKKLRLGYTVIDVGWWMHGFLPALPSGKTEYVRLDMPPGINTLPGDGNVPTAVTDADDVGRFVARVIVDERTLNKMIFVYGDVVTPNQAYELMEKLSGEKFERKYVTEDNMLLDIAAAKEALAKGTADMLTIFKIPVLQYNYSFGIRGDNAPEYARYLGYLDARDLYSDLKGTSLAEFFLKVLAGKARKPYSGNN